jgi:hypothetical protein
MHCSTRATGPYQGQWVRGCFRGPGTAGQGTNAKYRWHRGDIGRPFLPDRHGIETFDQLFHAARQIPILILSALQHEDLAKLAVQRGAHDFC